MINVLLVEDDPVLVGRIELIGSREGWHVNQTEDGEDAVEMAKTWTFDVILLDLGLVGILTGFQVLHRLGMNHILAPVVIITRMSGPEDQHEGFSLGCVDYIPKPFGDQQLIDRVNASIRKAAGAPLVLRVGRLGVYADRPLVTIDDVPLPCTGKEREILRALARSAGRSYSRAELMSYLYAPEDEPQDGVIPVFMSKLRKKIREATGGINYIHTASGKAGDGYSLEDRSVDNATK